MLGQSIVHQTVSTFSSRDPTPDESLGFTWQPAAHDDLQHLALTPTPAMKSDTRKQVRHEDVLFLDYFFMILFVFTSVVFKVCL